MGPENEEASFLARANPGQYDRALFRSAWNLCSKLRRSGTLNRMGNARTNPMGCLRPSIKAGQNQGQIHLQISRIAAGLGRTENTAEHNAAKARRRLSSRNTLSRIILNASTAAKRQNNLQATSISIFFLHIHLKSYMFFIIAEHKNKSIP